MKVTYIYGISVTSVGLEEMKYYILNENWKIQDICPKDLENRKIQDICPKDLETSASEF